MEIKKKTCGIESNNEISTVGFYRFVDLHSNVLKSFSNDL